MNRAEITRRTKKGESTTLELKRSTAALDRAVETLVAFLNAKGGTVLIGVRGDGSADGIEVNDKTRQQVAAAIRQIEPAADVAIEYIEVAPKRTVIAVTCEPGSHGPYTVDGRAYVRVDNTGTMAPGIHVEDLKRNHISAPRNPTIAETFYRRGLIEKWGRGTQKILEVCKAAGNPEPEFEEQGGGVIARFFPRPEGIEPGGITTRQAAILRFIRQSGEVGLSTILSNLQERITDRTLRRELEVLIQKGFIERRGAAKTTRYRSAR